MLRGAYVKARPLLHLLAKVPLLQDAPLCIRGDQHIDIDSKLIYLF